MSMLCHFDTQLPFDESLSDLLEDDFDGLFSLGEIEEFLDIEFESIASMEEDSMSINLPESTSGDSFFTSESLQTQINLPVEKKLPKKSHRPKKQTMLNKSKTSKITKLPKRDIRRMYFLMFLNITNAFDLVLLEDFFRRYCRPQLSFTHTPDVCPMPPLLTGFESIMEFWRWNFTVFPDCIVKLESCKIISSFDDKPSQIIAHITGKCTKVFNSKINVNDGENKESCNENVRKTDFYAMKKGKPRLSTLAELEEIDKKIFDEDAELMLTPLSLTFSSNAKFFLDCNKCIERFELCDATDGSYKIV